MPSYALLMDEINKEIKKQNKGISINENLEKNRKPSLGR